MNNRYNIGKVLYKVDSYVDRCQDTIYTQNIISDNQIIKNELTIGEGADDEVVKISQKTNSSTGELEGNIETSNIKITKELKYEGNNNTIINDSGINADSIYVNNLYTTNYNPTNLKTQNIIIVDENEQETGTKINKNGIEANTIKTHNLEIDNLNIDELVFKNQQETITNTINKDGIFINNSSINKSIGLNSNGELLFNNKSVNDIKTASIISNDDKLLTSKGYVDEAINEAITGGGDIIKVNVLQSKNQDSIKVYNDLILKDENDNKYNVIGDYFIGNYKSAYSDNPKVLINNNGITLNNKSISDINISNTQGALNNTIPTTDKVQDMINEHVPVLDGYAEKAGNNDFTGNNTFSTGNIIFNNGLSTASSNPNIIINNNDGIIANSIKTSSNNPKVLINNDGLTLNNNLIIDIDKSNNNNDDNNKIPTTDKVQEMINNCDLDDYVKKTGNNTITANNTYSTGNIIFNNGLSTLNMTLNNNQIIDIIKLNNDDTDNNKKLYTVKKTDDLLNNKANISDIPDVSNFITKEVDNLTYYTTTTNANNLYVSKSGNNNISANNTFSGNNTFNTNAINANSGITTSSGDLNLTSTTGNINLGNNTTLSTTSNKETLKTDYLIGDYKSNINNPSVIISNNTSSDGIVLNINDTNNNNNLYITNSGKITATELNTNNINGNNNNTMTIKPIITDSTNIKSTLNLNNHSKIESDYINNNIIDTLTTDNININNIDVSNILKTNTINNHNGSELTISPININNAVIDTEYKINLGFNSSITSIKTQDGQDYKLEDTIKSDKLLINQVIIGEITTTDDGIYSTAKIESGSKDNNDILHPKTGLYNNGDIKANNSIILKSGNDLKTNTNNLVIIEKALDNNNNECGKISIINPNINNNENDIIINSVDGSINKVKTSNLLLSDGSNFKNINSVSADIIGSSGSNSTLATEAYVLAQTSGTITTDNINAKTITLNYDNTASPSPSAEQIKIKNSSNETIFLVNGQTKETIINNTITTSSGDLNIIPFGNVNIQKPLKINYSLEDNNIIKINSNIYKGITYNYDNLNYTASIININMTNEQSIIIPRYIIYDDGNNENYYKIISFNNNLTLTNTALNGYIYIPDTIEEGLNNLFNVLLNNTILINMPINLYCEYLLNLTENKEYNNLTIILRNNNKGIYNINQPHYNTNSFIINLSSINSSNIEEDKIKITTLFNEYVLLNSEKFKNMPNEHYDLLSNSENNLNDKLIKEYHKKMLYLKNGFSYNSNINELSNKIFSYNPYYTETDNNNDYIQIFNTELNKIIVNDGTTYKYSYKKGLTLQDTGISATSTDLQKAFIKDETLYKIYKKQGKDFISIESIWSFNPNIKINNIIDTNIIPTGEYYCIYAYPYIIIYCEINNNIKLYYSTNMLYWQSIILFESETLNNPIINYINNKNLLIPPLTINSTDLNITKENMIIINDIKNIGYYIIYPSYTKEELFMRL